MYAWFKVPCFVCPVCLVQERFHPRSLLPKTRRQSCFTQKFSEQSHHGGVCMLCLFSIICLLVCFSCTCPYIQRKRLCCEQECFRCEKKTVRILCFPPSFNAHIDPRKQIHEAGIPLKHVMRSHLPRRSLAVCTRRFHPSTPQSSPQ